MSLLTIFISPLLLLFFTIVLGISIGKIHLGRISLGIAGVLFAGILAGVLTQCLVPETDFELIIPTKNTMKEFSTLGSALFVSVIGLQTGLSIKNNSKEAFVSFSIGTLMSVSGVFAMMMISIIDKTISFPSLLGILCGALTSTPGLSSVCEIIDIGMEDAVWSYGCSYLIGVVLVVLFSQLIISRTKTNTERKRVLPAVVKDTLPELVLVSTVALIGGILGIIQLPFLRITIGNTASTLLVGLVIGYFVQRYADASSLAFHNLNTLKSFGLAFFFAGNGFTTGMQSITFEIKTILYGSIITLTALFCGYLLCQTIYRGYRLHAGLIIAGGMTSSPAYGAIQSKIPHSSTNDFSFAYFGAIISLVVAIQIVARY